MKKTNRKRISLVAIATAFFLITTLDTPQTIPAVPENLAEPPSPEEVIVLEELLDWVRGGPRETRFSPLGGSDLLGAVRARPQSFELFRTFHQKEARQELINSFPFGSLIRSAATRHRIDGLLLAAVIEAESSFNPQAVSVDGALGLMQIMPSTAEHLGRSQYGEPAVNVDLGARYLSWLLRLYDGDVALALAAYNAGPGNVERFQDVPPFAETRSYVERVLSRYVDHHQSLWRSAGAGAWLPEDSSLGDAVVPDRVASGSLAG